MGKNNKNPSLTATSKTVFCLKLLTVCFAVLLTFVLTLSVCAVCAAARIWDGQLVSPDTAVIVLDAGHGGIDGGVTGKQTGVKESDLNLQYVRELEKMLTDAGFKVVLTRDTSGGLYGISSKGFKRRDMQKRREIIESAKPLLVISVHMNKYSAPSRSGAQVFFQIGDAESARLATLVQTQLNRLSERAYSGLSGDFYILQNLCPSIIVECGFLSNAAEELLLCDDDHRRAVCRAVLEGAMLYLLG